MTGTILSCDSFSDLGDFFPAQTGRISLRLCKSIVGYLSGCLLRFVPVYYRRFVCDINMAGMMKSI